MNGKLELRERDLMVCDLSFEMNRCLITVKDVSHRPQILNALTASSDNVSHQAMIVHSESIRRPEVSFAGHSQVPRLPSFHSIFSAERNEQQIEAVRSQPYGMSLVLCN